MDKIKRRILWKAVGTAIYGFFTYCALDNGVSLGILGIRLLENVIYCWYKLLAPLSLHPEDKRNTVGVCRYLLAVEAEFGNLWQERRR